jgi:hypothetical protein
MSIRSHPLAIIAAEDNIMKQPKIYGPFWGAASLGVASFMLWITFRVFAGLGSYCMYPLIGNWIGINIGFLVMFVMGAMRYQSELAKLGR